DATATPGTALSTKTTTARTEPPKGSTKATPSNKERTSRGTNQAGTEATASTITARARIAIPIRPLTTCWPGYVIGVPVKTSCSFAKAIQEPPKEMEPITIEKMLGRVTAKPG